ncbi:MAG: hypothetical protein GX837_03300, partial [Methanomicrobiales archaeon]|nr:hypothetical protein [Methanomicrobiales archaeon]
MRKLTHPALLCAIVIIGLLISPVMAVDAAPGEMIYRPFVNGQERPDIDGDMIVWEDDRNGNKDIYFGTVDEFRDKPPLPTIRIGEGITSDDASQEKPSISGDYIVWQDNRHGNWDIYLYDRSTETTTQLTNDTGNQWMPAVSGNYAAWYDNSSSKTNIVLYDIAADSVKDVIECDAKTTIPGGTTEFKPALSENYVAWMEKTDWKVHYYDIGAGTTEGLGSTSEAVQCWPSLSGSLIAWEDERHGNPDIYMTDLDNPSGGEKRVTFDGADQVSAANSETIIAWEETRVPPRSIYMYDLSPPGKELLVIDADDSGDEHLYPAVSGNTIVWQNRRGPSANLYIFIYKPAEPVDPVATTIEVNPSTFTLDLNGTVTFEATVLDQFDETMSGIDVEWASDNETVGTIDNASGLFTALAAGTATVTATVGEITGEATVTVNANADEPVASVVTRIELDPSTFTLDINATKQFTATAFDQFEEEMAGIAFNWSCDNETVGTIDDSTGLFTAKSAGTAT